MSKEPMFDARKAAGMIKHFLLGELAGVQQRILLVERFGPDAVTFAMLGRKGTDKLPELISRHDELVAQIDALQEAGDKASDAVMKAFVQDVKRRNKV